MSKYQLYQLELRTCDEYILKYVSTHLSVDEAAGAAYAWAKAGKKVIVQTAPQIDEAWQTKEDLIKKHQEKTRRHLRQL